MNNQTYEIVRGTLITVAVGGAILAVIVVSIRKSEEPFRMFVQWVFTAVVLVFGLKVVAPMVARGDIVAAFLGVPLAALSGLTLAIIWRHTITETVTQPIMTLFMGGTTPPDPTPFYSTANANRKKGRVSEAIAEVKQQLEKFPGDMEGQMLLAEMLAVDLKDLAGAEMVINDFCRQSGHSPRNVTFALYSMADWHLSVGKDRDAARRSLEQVVQLFPDSEFSLSAAQRLARLGNPQTMVSQHSYAVPEASSSATESLPGTTPEPSPDTLIEDLQRHLAAHPLDCSAREQLAVLFVNHCGRLDLATEQLQQVIQNPAQPNRVIVRCLNLLADLQVRMGSDLEIVQNTLQTIIDRAPRSASAEMARNRMALLKLELKAKEKSQDIPLGSYEQNLGLKGRLPHKL